MRKIAWTFAKLTPSTRHDVVPSSTRRGHWDNVASMAWGARILIPTQVGGEYDNGERFDLRLPYVDQGYEDPDADVMGKLMDMFKKKPPKEE